MDDKVIALQFPRLDFETKWGDPKNITFKMSSLKQLHLLCRIQLTNRGEGQCTVFEMDCSMLPALLDLNKQISAETILVLLPLVSTGRRSDAIISVKAC